AAASAARPAFVHVKTNTNEIPAKYAPATQTILPAFIPSVSHGQGPPGGRGPTPTGRYVTPSLPVSGARSTHGVLVHRGATASLVLKMTFGGLGSHGTNRALGFG